MEKILRDGFEELGLTFTGEALARFNAYYEYLDQRNRVMNLTAITRKEDTARLHFLDCAALLKAADFSGARVVDVGTGAGFPGLPLKIISPDISLTLLDSQKKRVDFLTETCEKLGFRDVVCLHARAEEAAAEMRETFDIAVSRAVARLNILCELCMPFVRPGGLFLAMKGPDFSQELSEAEHAISVLGGKTLDIFSYTIPGTNIVHSVALIKKVQSTPDRYPRRFARIQKSPL
ncbi:MAG TPA: 16S rRNA (guanine(527)-N(7))-methyltransferase RsmG [Clostridiales bacterium]|nr:16S rRNA (guanine(527)-N(7))-methyltransferase RsmG [Clostridiales bacterium]